MTPVDVIKTVFPDAHIDVCEYIIWNRTAYPFEIKAKTLYKAAARYKRCLKNDICLCDYCNNKIDKSKYVCDNCKRNLS